MTKTYLYNGNEYSSEYSVRAAILQNENKAFGKEPEENKEEFWAALGVTYTETETVVSLDTLKSTKLITLERAFLQWYEDDATVTSSLGFVADSDARAITDVSGLITVAEATPEEERTTVAFMDHENQVQMLSLDQLKTLQLEIIQNGQYAYQQKWVMRSAIEAAEDQETLEAIEIVFTGMDFTEASE